MAWNALHKSTNGQPRENIRSTIESGYLCRSLILRPNVNEAHSLISSYQIPPTSTRHADGCWY